MTSILAAVLSAVVTAGAQQKTPDFSGMWVLAKDRSSQTTSGSVVVSVSGLLGDKFSAVQDAKTLTLTRLQGDQTVTETVNLDGSETREMIEALGGTRERVSRATWDGNKLVINATLSVDGKILQQNRVMSMEGGNLVIEQIGPGGGGPATIRRVFKKG